MEAIRFETTVGLGGTLILPNIQAGERVEVIVLRFDSPRKPVRKGGWIKGKIVIHSDFDDPIPGLEDYM